LNEYVGDTGDTTAMDFLVDGADTQEERLIDKEREAELSRSTKKALKKLDQRERFIITKRFMDESPWTLQKLGDYFGTSRERVRQLEKRALNKLRLEIGPQFSENMT